MTDELRAQVYMNRGWWVAECPHPDCDNATWFGVARNGAGVGGLTPDYMACTDCERAYSADWPDYDMRQGVEQLLADRPNPKNRNWLPHETLTDLLAENIEHGIGPGLASLEGHDRRECLIEIKGGEITIGRAIASRRHERLMIPGAQ